MTKFTLNLTEQQETLVDSLKDVLGVTSRTDVFRKALALALLYKEIKESNHNLVITDNSGNMIERIRLI